MISNIEITIPKGILAIAIITAVISIGIVTYSCLDISPIGYEGNVHDRITEICTFNGSVSASCVDKKLNINEWCSFLHE